jgi:MerR family transcriptional regulator, light-induced transcriptional regulator
MSARGETIRIDRDMLDEPAGYGALAPPNAGRPAPRGADARHAALFAAIEGEIIPRLLLAHGERHAIPARPQPNAADVAGLVALVLARQDDSAADYVLAVQARGIGIEELYLGLLAPTAHRLGELWEQDLCDFTQVTMGLWRLHQALRDFAPAFIGTPAPRRDGASVMLVPLPGQQHTFGLDMVVQFFLRAGWTVLSPTLASDHELAAAMRGNAVAVVGFTVGSTGERDAVASAIRTVRRAMSGRPVGVMVGGPAFVRDPRLAMLVGADATACDAPEAVLRAEALLVHLAGIAVRRGAFR